MSKKSAFLVVASLVIAVVLGVLSVTVHAAGTCYVQITKTLVADDINWANGNPVFVYELSTMEGISANNYKHYAIIEFTKEYVDSNTAADGYVSMTTHIRGVYPDEYSLTERDTLRYKTTAVTNVENGVAYDSYYKQLEDGTLVNVPKKEVEFNLNKNSYGAATFNAEKTYWADASHTAVAVNHFQYVGSN